MPSHCYFNPFCPGCYVILTNSVCVIISLIMIISHMHFWQYATRLEKNKLFIRGLPFTITREALEAIFSEVSILLSVRASSSSCFIAPTFLFLHKTVIIVILISPTANISRNLSICLYHSQSTQLSQTSSHPYLLSLILIKLNCHPVSPFSSFSFCL